MDSVNLDEASGYLGLHEELEKIVGLSISEEAGFAERMKILQEGVRHPNLIQSLIADGI